jgi:DNA-binding beta-propeller fold protein YncE
MCIASGDCVPVFVGRAEIYVSNATPNTVTVYADDAQDDAAPIRTLQGPDTELDFPAGIALDLIHNELFLVPQFGVAKVNVYPLNADGNQAPIRTIDGANTGIERPIGMAVDPVNDQLYVATYTNASIRVFTRTADGNVTPLRVIEGPETRITGPSGIFVDLEHDEIFVTNILPGAVDGSILVFSRTADGNVQPIRSLEGPSVLLQWPQWIFVSQQHDELYVSDQRGSINVYPRTADGDVAPIRSIAGPNTMLSDPLGILLTADGELLLANGGGDSILFFPRLADGDFVPSRIIAGGATGLATPIALGSTLAAEGSVGYAGPLCQPEMGLICPPSGDPQVWIDGFDVQINGGIFTPPPCEPVARINWDWGDQTSSDSFFPAVHTYPERTEYKITAVALDAGDTEIIRASCDISLQVIFENGFE